MGEDGHDVRGRDIAGHRNPGDRSGSERAARMTPHRDSIRRPAADLIVSLRSAFPHSDPGGPIRLRPPILSRYAANSTSSIPSMEAPSTRAAGPTTRGTSAIPCRAGPPRARAQPPCGCARRADGGTEVRHDRTPADYGPGDIRFE